jgi:chromosome segregation ATPase
MLSSGEKSLTAISLLFAIYLVKPSPFCILDEVDAPLDDNILKFLVCFPGGFAKISISDINLIGDDDPLDSDIEIFAKPPGKHTRNLRMLSSGEKSLTAISLLFAIYLVKPSPFCILDEVDAPLDDNILKFFTNVLQKFSKNTQFIIVTHNKLTMESNTKLIYSHQDHHVNFGLLVTLVYLYQILLCQYCDLCCYYVSYFVIL